LSLTKKIPTIDIKVKVTHIPLPIRSYALRKDKDGIWYRDYYYNLKDRKDFDFN